ncbi:hypothetical protein ACP3VW_09690 [Vibrio sp. DNB22_17_1]
MLKNWLEHEFYFGKAKARFVYHFDGIDDLGILDSPITLGIGDSLTFTTKVVTDGYSKVISGASGFFQMFPSNQSAVARLYDDNSKYAGAWKDSAHNHDYINKVVTLRLTRTLTGYGLTRLSDSGDVFLGELASTNSFTFDQFGHHKVVSQIYDIEVSISGITTKWAMDNKGEAIQPSIPSGNNLTIANMNSERWYTV